MLKLQKSGKYMVFMYLCIIIYIRVIIIIIIIILFKIKIPRWSTNLIWSTYVLCTRDTAEKQKQTTPNIVSVGGIC